MPYRVLNATTDEVIEDQVASDLEAVDIAGAEVERLRESPDRMDWDNDIQVVCLDHGDVIFICSSTSG